MNNFDIERLKDANPLADIMTEDGIALAGNGNKLVGYHSNRHESQSKTSLHVDPAQELYHCFNCGEGGDVITWLIRNRNMSFIEACRYLSARAGIPLPDIDPEEQKRQNERRQEQEQLWDLYTAAADIYHGMLGEKGYRLFLDKWGLTEETAKKFKFGFAPVSENFIMQSLLKRGFEQDLIMRSGLVNEYGYDYFQGRLIFPYWRNGKVVYFIGRRIDDITPEEKWEQAKFKKLPVYNENHGHISQAVCNEFFAGEDTARGAEELIITEGIADCYAAIQAGFACTSPVTVTFRKADFPRMAQLAKRVKTVYLINDNEVNKAGEKGALATAKYLEEQGINAKLVELPRPEGIEKIDLADYLKKYTVNNLDSFNDTNDNEKIPLGLEPLQYKGSNDTNDTNGLKTLLKEAKTLLELTLDKLRQDPKNNEVLQEAIKRIAKQEGVQRDVLTDSLYQIVKKLGIKKSTLEKEIMKSAGEQSQGDKEEEKETQQDILIQLADTSLLFKNEFKEPFARVNMDDHQEIWKCTSRDFKYWLIKKYYDKIGKGTNSEALNSAINTISAKAFSSKEEYKLQNRTAELDSAFWYDLADKQWRAVKVTSGGWEIQQPPVLFQRYGHQQAQPEPSQNGNVFKLLEFVNLKDDNARILFLVSMVTSFVPDIPHIIFVIFGGEGTGKSTTCKATRMVIDPSGSLACGCYDDKREFVQYMAHNYVILLDNLSGMSKNLSDTICSAVTGDGASKRMLFTDDSDVIYNFKRVFIINGINCVVTQPDLLRRSILFQLEPIPEEKRIPEKEFWTRFEGARPAILGGVFNALAKAMRIYPDVKLTGLYDMADFTLWGYAVAETLGLGGDNFLTAYTENRGRQVAEAIANNQIGLAITLLMQDETEWIGKPSDLLTELEKIAEAEKINTKAKSWPKAANSLTRRLNEAKTILSKSGINFEERHDGTKREIYLCATDKKNTVRTVNTVRSQEYQGLSINNTVSNIVSKPLATNDTVSKNNDIDNKPLGREALRHKELNDTNDTNDIFSTFKASKNSSKTLNNKLSQFKGKILKNAKKEVI